MSEPLTMETVLAAYRMVCAVPSGPARLMIVTSDALIEARQLSRWERWRARIEDAADRADLIYPFQRVRRTQPMRKALQIGGCLYCHPAVAATLRKAVSG